MQYISFFAVRHDTGAALPRAQINVYQPGTTTQAQAYDIDGSAIGQPISADGNGEVGFSMPNGSYDVQIQAGGYSAPLIKSLAFFGGQAGRNYTVAPALTYSGQEEYGFSFATTPLNAYNIYSAIFPGVDFFDTLQGVTEVVAGSTIEQATGIAGYVRNEADSAGGGTNGVAVFGAAQAVSSGANVWGLNTLLQDALSRTIGTDTRKYLLGAELDFNIMNPATQVLGVSVGGNSLVQPSVATAFIANTLGNNPAGGVFNWDTAFASLDGCAQNFAGIGLASSVPGPNIDSQTVLFASTDGSANRLLHLIYTSGDYVVIDGIQGVEGLHDSHGNLAVRGYITLDTGNYLAIGGEPVIAARKTGWGIPGGTLSRDYYNTGSATLTQVAETLAALITDLAGHGLIGA